MKQRPIRQSIDPKIIRTDLGTQARNGNSEETIEEYVEAMENGAEFPPLVVFFDIVTSLYILADGFHRLIAHLRVRPNGPIIVEQYSGTVEDAQWYSIGANKSHGLKRTNEDKRNAVELALLHTNGVGKSDNSIANHVGVSQKSVCNIRRRLVSENRLSNLLSRVGADGRVYDVSNIGKKNDEPCFCAGCGHYKRPRCFVEGETREPFYPACNEYVPAPPPEPEKPDDEEEADDPRFGQDFIPKEVQHRVSRRKSGEYIEVPLSRTNTDLAAAEIRHFFDDNYLAALVQSALKILKD